MKMTSDEFETRLKEVYLTSVYPGGSPLETTASVICPEGHTIEVFGPDMERTEEDGKIVWQKKKPYWWTSRQHFSNWWVVYGRGTTVVAEINNHALSDAQERAEKLVTELNRDYPNGLPK